MNGFTVQLNSTSDAQGFSADLVDATGLSGFRLFESSASADGAFSTNATVISCGESAAFSAVCVSDKVLMQADIESTWSGLAMVDTSGVGEMSDHAQHMGEVAKNMMAKLPEVNKGLDGQLSFIELSGLIDSLQSQLLELNSVCESIYGGLGREIASDTRDLELAATEELLAAAEVAASETMDQSGVLPETFSNMSAQNATLDALFTHPESFPLTLDFSEEASVTDTLGLFGDAGQSISSSAQPEAGSWNSGDSTGDSLV
ncbi:MAG: hypothetical protein R3194_03175 [Limnobacter sp.]|nr:hypothetical protein [Limnobacter sp.]